MHIKVALSNDTARFSGTIDDKAFNFTVEEFINLIGAFQQAVAKVQGTELPVEDIISITNLKEHNNE